MPIIAPEILEQIRARVDIAELVGERVSLTRAGRGLKGRCPFHEERTPSFNVSPERQTYHCFGCGEGGDIFSFAMKTDGLSFVEAAERLASRAGIKLEADRGLGPEEKERLRAREALAFAAKFYHELLLKEPAAEPGRRYAAERGLDAAALEGFLLGYAPRAGSLAAAARRAGFEEDLLLKAGLAARRPDGSLRDYFFDRLLFPIRDAKGAVVGFGGRTLGDGQPKYLNSADSAVFGKGRLLYGLWEGLGSVRKSRRALLMEGYMDVIAAHRRGFDTACAPLGTALTPEQAALLKRCADSVIIVFDSDEAGLKASVRGADLALAAGLSVRLATVPEGKDPDGFLRAKGPEAFRAALEAARDPAEFKTDLLLARAQAPLSAEDKSEIARSVLATISQARDEVVKDEWTRRLARRLGVSEEALRRAAAAPAARPAPPRPAAGAAAGSSAPARAVPAAPPVLPAADLQLLGLLVKAPACAGEAREDDWESEAARSLARAARGAGEPGAGWGARFLEALEDGGARALGSRLLVEENLYDDPAAHFRELLERGRARRRLRELDGEMARALHQGAPVAQELREEHRRLASRLYGTRR